jgi:hypothetical protein
MVKKNDDFGTCPLSTPVERGCRRLVGDRGESDRRNYELGLCLTWRHIARISDLCIRSVIVAWNQE